jgi:hypothetical protein
MLRAFARSVLGAAGLALVLAGCSPAPLLGKLPESMGGLPANAPARPTTAYEYPAVHDMPPPRATQPMSDADQIKMERDLSAARDRQASSKEANADDADKPKKAAPAAKKKPKAGKDGGPDSANTGAKTNP